MPTLVGTIVWASWLAIIYCYFLFPLVLAAIVRVRGPRGSTARDLPEESLPPVTMVVAAYNEGAVIEAKLANCAQISYPRHLFRVIIGSDGSTDETNRILRECTVECVEPVIFAQRRGKISVLNDLMEMVRTEAVVMSDASTMFDPSAVRKLVRHFEDPMVGCVTGELNLKRDGGASGEGFYLKYERWIKRQEGALGCVIGCVGAIFAIRKSAYRVLPPATIVEDFMLCMRVLEQRLMARAEPEAHATDPPCTSSREEMRRKVRIGAGGFQAIGMARRVLHPRYGVAAFAFWGHKVLRWLVPVFSIVAVVGCAVLVAQPFYRIALAAQLLGALIAAAAYNPAIGDRMPRWTRPISYFYLMNYALLRGLGRYLFGTQKVTWERAAASAE